MTKLLPAFSPLFRGVRNNRWSLNSSVMTLSSAQKRELHSGLGCNVYISEGRDKRLIEYLKAEAQATAGVALANVFVDAPYHRTGFTFVSDQPDKLTAAVVRLSRAALQLLDLRLHDATHPRLGVVDHISLHPLGSLVPRPMGPLSPKPPSPSARHRHSHGHATGHSSPPSSSSFPAASSTSASSTAAAAAASGAPHSHSAAQPGRGTSAGSAGGGSAHGLSNPRNHNHHNHHNHRAESRSQLAGEGEEDGYHDSGGSGGSGGGSSTMWEAPPPGLRGLAVAASCAHDIAWTLSGVGDSGTYDPDGLEAPAAAGPGAGAGPGSGQQQQQQQQQQQNPHVYGVPVYMYGFAHSSRRSLATVRRELGYFKRSPDGGWHGEVTHGPHLAADLERFPPDLGPLEAPPRSGLVTIGAVPWVVNYNIPLVGVSLQSAGMLAKALSERGGGLPGVESVALTHSSDCVEVACNLLDSAATPPQQVQSRLLALAHMRGVAPEQVRPGYITNKSPEELLRAAVAQLEGGGGSGAGGWRRQ